MAQDALTLYTHALLRGANRGQRLGFEAKLAPAPCSMPWSTGRMLT